MTIERGQDTRFAGEHIREAAGLPSGLERALEMKRDRGMAREAGGGVYTLNDWDRPERQRVKGADRDVTGGETNGK